MNINALFTHKHTHALLTLAFEAATQQEFNYGLSDAENEAARQMRQFSTEVETLTGDDAQLAGWFAAYEVPPPRFQPIVAQEDAWHNDHLQFARLLRELDLAGALTPGVMAKLTESMDCGEEMITQLVERVTASFDEYQARPRQRPIRPAEGRMVTWQLYLRDDEADTALGAAQHAFAVQQDPHTTRREYLVEHLGSGKVERIDLDCLPDNAWKVVDYSGDEHRAYEEVPDYYTSEQEARAAYQKLADAGAPVRLYGGHDDGEEVGEWEIIEQANEEKLAPENA